MYGMIDAIYALRPGVKGFTLKGNDYSGLEWKNDTHTKPTEEEINQKIAELNVGAAHKALRDERNRRLAETDWTQSRDVNLLNDSDWKNYRQALRDLPSKSNPKLDSRGTLDISSVTWPTKPSS
tara:strand:- start:40 stop:411 length:372 start_codon:yes stop_codon:yes gene_type:complete